MPKGEIGFNQQEHDHALLWRAATGDGTLRVVWEGYGSVGSTPSSVYLRRTGTARPSQCLYIPEGVLIKMTCWGVAYESDTPDYAILNQAVATTGAYRTPAGGNVTLEGSGEITSTGDAAASTWTITANTTVQGLEVVVADADTSSKTWYTKLVMDIQVMDISTEGLSHIVAGATAALTTVESI
jgi:hypothetical protein